MDNSFFNTIPLAAFFVLTVFLTISALEIGYQLSRYLSLKNCADGSIPLQTMTQAALGLLAFMMAFTFGMSAERANARRLLIVDEANSIGTTYLRSAFLPEPNKAVVQQLLREYVKGRVSASRDTEVLTATLPQSQQLQDRLWAQAVDAGNRLPNSHVVALFIDSLNQTIDLQGKRVAAVLHAHVPASIWFSLYVLLFLSMLSVGFQGGCESKKRNWLGTLVLVTSFSVVIILIADLDRATEGLLRASLEPLIELQTRLDQ